MTLNPEDFAWRFHPYRAEISERDTAKIDTMHGMIVDTAAQLDSFAQDGREKAVAFTKLEEALMWAVKAIQRPS
jgi:hypothetical protein